MLPLTPTTRRQPWGSSTAIAHALGRRPDGGAVAEAWFGAHPTAPAVVESVAEAWTLGDYLAADPSARLGDAVVAEFGPRLPYLLKLIAADAPLSLQVHPGRAAAAAGYAAEQAAGRSLDAPDRAFRDPVHRPELLYALTQVEGVVGFRAPRRAAELLAGLDAPLAGELRARLAATPGPAGVHAATSALLDPATRPAPDEIAAFVAACAARLATGSPSPRADALVVRLGSRYPWDPCVPLTLLLNPVTLAPGQALFVPCGTPHAYESGLAVELMAASDDELRFGLTDKPTDVAGALAVTDWVAAPPVRLAPEVFHGVTRVFSAPVDDFELSVTTVDSGLHPLPGRGPRVLLCLDGIVVVAGGDDAYLVLGQGSAAFVPAADGPLTVGGAGTLVQAGVP